MAIEKDRIRRADAADCAAVLTCVCAAYSKYVARIGREPAPMRADYATLIERRVVHVVSDPTTDALCGIIVLWPKDGAMFIENVAVHPHYQGRRLGRRLMAFAEEQARAGGFRELHLYTNEAMTENLQFYAHLGFEETSRHGDEGYSRVFLRKKLHGV